MLDRINPDLSHTIEGPTTYRGTTDTGSEVHESTEAFVAGYSVPPEMKRDIQSLPNLELLKRVSISLQPTAQELSRAKKATGGSDIGILSAFAQTHGEGVTELTAEEVSAWYSLVEIMANGWVALASQSLEESKGRQMVHVDVRAVGVENPITYGIKRGSLSQFSLHTDNKKFAYEDEEDLGYEIDPSTVVDVASFTVGTDPDTRYNNGLRWIDGLFEVPAPALSSSLKQTEWQAERNPHNPVVHNETRNLLQIQGGVAIVGAEASIRQGGEDQVHTVTFSHCVHSGSFADQQDAVVRVNTSVIYQ